MKWTFASLIAVVAMELHAPAPADACGVKLTVKSGAPRKAVARSSNPSQVLLLGRPPRRLERDLVAAGHRVEVASAPTDAKQKQYAVVITDSNLEPEARKNFNGSVIVVRSDDVVADIRSVENNVARRPVRVADNNGNIVAAAARRQPIAVGPNREPDRRPVGARPTEAEPTPTPAPPRVVATRPAPTPKPEPKAVEPKPEPKPAADPPPVADPKPTKPAPTVDEPKDPPTKPVATVKPSASEVYFSVNDADAGARANAAIAKAARWMTANASINVTIEGHADPTGNADANMALSQRRAEWVRDQLVAAGIDSSRIEVVALGDTKLKYGGADARNRRVAIVPKP